MSIRNPAKDSGVSPQTIQAWKKSESKPYKCKPSKIDDDILRKDLDLYHDAYQYERALRFDYTDRGIAKALKILGITQKKDTPTPKI